MPLKQMVHKPPERFRQQILRVIAAQRGPFRTGAHGGIDQPFAGLRVIDRELRGDPVRAAGPCGGAVLPVQDLGAEQIFQIQCVGPRLGFFQAADPFRDFDPFGWTESAAATARAVSRPEFR